MPADACFEKVSWGSFLDNECTPKVPEAFRGIRIAAPSRVRVGPGHHDRFTDAIGSLMICGVYQLDGLFVRRHGIPPMNGVVVAVNVDSHAVQAAPMTPPHPPAPKPPPPPDPWPEPTDEEVARQWQEGYFNENALAYLRLPEETATYDVHVTVGPATSNVVRVKVELDR